MERQQSFKLELNSSLEAEPRTLSKKEYELAMAALRAYMGGNIEEESSTAEKATLQAGERKPPVGPKANKEAAGPSTSTSTGTGSGDMKLSVLS